MKLKVLRQLCVQFKETGRTRTLLKFVNPKLKTINDASFRVNKENMSDMSFRKLAFFLTFLVDRVGNFKQINIELQTFKLHKVGSK